MSEREEVLREFGSTWRTTATDAMAYEIVRLRSQLATAERERDEARRERDVANAEREAIRQVAIVYKNELSVKSHRAERAERVVEAAREYEKNRHTHWQRALWEAVRALDAAEGT